MAEKDVETEVATTKDAASASVAVNDLGRWVGRTHLMSANDKIDLLQRCWKPPPSYDFSEGGQYTKRKFRYDWLEMYAPWLVYSSHLKGALCLYCVLFPPATSTVQGFLGAFVVKPFTRYKDMHSHCQKHVEGHWHQTSALSAKAFMSSTPVDFAIVSARQETIAENRKILASIVSTVGFCGMHDLPLRGKEQHEGVFEDLLQVRVDAGDEQLRQHLGKAKKNAMYTSPQIQNEVISLFGSVIKHFIIEDVKKR